jgi:hypothetical protein
MSDSKKDLPKMRKTDLKDDSDVQKPEVTKASELSKAKVSARSENLPKTKGESKKMQKTKASSKKDDAATTAAPGVLGFNGRSA